MVDYCVYYGSNGERCIVRYDDPLRFRQKLPVGAKWDYPDEVQLISLPLIKREKTLDEMRAEGLKKYGHDFRLYAKDIPLSQAIPKEFK
jgi:hypothetical protein